MSIELTGLKIFIATPGGLSAERSAFRKNLTEYNENHGFDNGFCFIPIGWEDVTPGVGRPQHTINAELSTCDYLVLVLWDRWGSPPVGESAASSGTYVEFCIALARLAEESAPMKDIIVAFKAVDEEQMGAPTDDFLRVMQFKQELELAGDLFFGTFDSLEDLDRLLHRGLTKWMATSHTKRAVLIQPPDLDQLFATINEDGIDSAVVLQQAIEYESQGLMTQAEYAYAKASLSRDVETLERYAIFLRRTGRLTRSFEVNEEILGLDLVVADDSDSGRSIRADALANMGLIRRKQGRLAESKTLLEESVDTARSGGALGGKVLAYALDNLGITLKRRDETEAAMEAHREALVIHRSLGNPTDEAKSVINVARLLTLQGRTDEAENHLEQTLENLESSHDRTYANALVALGECHLNVGRTTEAAEKFEEALAINQSLHNATGIAVAAGQLSRAARLGGDLDTAIAYARQSVRANEDSANLEGLAIALRLLGESLLEAGSIEESRGHLLRALELLEQQGSPHGVEAVAELLLQVDEAA